MTVYKSITAHSSTVTNHLMTIWQTLKLKSANEIRCALNDMFFKYDVVSFNKLIHALDRLMSRYAAHITFEIT